jgi:hypothetical protein
MMAQTKLVRLAIIPVYFAPMERLASLVTQPTVASLTQSLPFAIALQDTMKILTVRHACNAKFPVLLAPMDQLVHPATPTTIGSSMQVLINAPALPSVISILLYRLSAVPAITHA